MDGYLSLPAPRRQTNSAISAAFSSVLPRLQSLPPTWEPTSAERRAWITQLCEDLDVAGGAWTAWDPTTLLQGLMILKCLGRVVIGSSQLALPASITLLCTHANLSPTSTSTSLSSAVPFPTSSSTAQSIADEALRILVNTLLLHPIARTESVAWSPFLPRLVAQALDPDPNYGFLPARLLFVVTASASLVIVELVEKTPLIDGLKAELEREAGGLLHAGVGIGSVVYLEWLKLLFNLMFHLPRSVPSRSSSPRSPNNNASTSSRSSARNRTSSSRSSKGRDRVRKFVEGVGVKMQKAQNAAGFGGNGNGGVNSMTGSGRESSEDGEGSVDSAEGDPRFDPLLRPVVALYLRSEGEATNHLLHALLNFSPTLPGWLPTSPPPSTTSTAAPLPAVIQKTYSILSAQLPSDPDTLYSSTPLSDSLTQTSTLLAQHFSHHSSLNTLASRAAMREALLPPGTDRKVGLDKRSDLVLGRVLGVMVSVGGGDNLRNMLGGWLVRVWESDPNRLTGDVGYGPLAGYLHSIGATFTPSATPSASSSASSVQLNPITGTPFSDPSNEPEMTEEEKEAEAERLTILFDRMNRSGVISVADPRKKAVEEGRFEELSREEEDEERKKEEREAKEGEEEMRRYRARMGRSRD